MGLAGGGQVVGWRVLLLATAEAARAWEADDDEGPVAPEAGLVDGDDEQGLRARASSSPRADLGLTSG